MRHVSLKVLAIYSAMFSTTLFAIEAQKAPDAKNWSETLERSQLEGHQVPAKLLILESVSKSTAVALKIAPLEFNSGLCAQVSFISCVVGSDFAYGLKINRALQTANEDELAKFADADGAIYADGGQVVFTLGQNSKKIHIEGAPKLNRSLDARRLFDRMLTTLGYDGVVLDIKGDYLLVGTLDARLKKRDLQGLLIKNSAESISIKSQSAKEGAALLALVGHYGGYAVFKSIIGTESVKLGQKVLIEGHR